MAKKKPRIAQWFKKKENYPLSEVACGNCQTVYKGHYCPECGQPAKEFDRPFSFVFYDFLGNFIAFDSRFYKTFLNLVLKPGFLTKEFFEGRRVRYSPPFRSFIFLSFVLFLLLQYFSNRGLSKALSAEVDGGVIQIMDDNGDVVSDSIMFVTPQEVDSALAEGGSGLDFDFSAIRDSNSLQSALMQLAGQLEGKLKTTADLKKQKKLQNSIRLLRSPEQALAKILKYISYACFLLLPIFALILKLFYVRRKQNYIKHLIFSIHLHSFWFLMVIVIMLLYLIFSHVEDVITFSLVLYCGIYFVIALKKFYGQRTGKTILKWIGISLMYYFVFWSVVVVAMLNALSFI